MESPQKATRVAPEREAEAHRREAPAARETTITVLNGNGVTGSAGTAGYLLSQRSYAMVYPPDGKNANAPNWEYFKTRIHYDEAQAGGRRGGEEGRDPVRHRGRAAATPKIAASRTARCSP